MSRADCDACDEHREKELIELHNQIASLKAALIKEIDRPRGCLAETLEYLEMMLHMIDWEDMR